MIMASISVFPNAEAYPSARKNTLDHQISTVQADSEDVVLPAIISTQPPQIFQVPTVPASDAGVGIADIQGVAGGGAS